MGARRSPTRMARVGNYEAPVESTGDAAMDSTLFGKKPSLGEEVRKVAKKKRPDYIDKGEKAYFKDKSYTPEQRKAVTDRAAKGIPNGN